MHKAGLRHHPLFWVVVLVAIYMAVSFSTPYDDTDPPGERSGMSVYVDHRTGCQYLRMGLLGGTVPRMDRDGRQICEYTP